MGQCEGSMLLAVSWSTPISKLSSYEQCSLSCTSWSLRFRLFARLKPCAVRMIRPSFTTFRTSGINSSFDDRARKYPLAAPINAALFILATFGRSHRILRFSGRREFVRLLVHPLSERPRYVMHKTRQTHWPARHMNHRLRPRPPSDHIHVDHSFDALRESVTIRTH